MRDNAVKIVKFNSHHASDLKKHKYFEGSNALNYGFINNVLKTTHLLPSTTNLVAYNTEEKKAIGFISLEKNTSSIFSIKRVYVDPDYRKMGIAKRLLNNVILIAKQKEAKKLNLNVSPENKNTIELYKKFGFGEIGTTVLGQKYINQSAPLRYIKRFVFGEGLLTKLAYDKSQRLIQIDTDCTSNREMLFSIFKKCIDQKWTDFFEIDCKNFLQGARNVWQPPFRSTLINQSEDTYATIFSRVLTHNAYVEIYSTSKDSIPVIVGSIIRTLRSRGVSIAYFTLFDQNKTAKNCLQDFEMTTFKVLAMGTKL